MIPACERYGQHFAYGDGQPCIFCGIELKQEGIMTFEEFLQMFVGREIASIDFVPLEANGNGPRSLMIRFKDGAMMSTFVEDLKLVNERGVTEWRLRDYING